MVSSFHSTYSHYAIADADEVADFALTVRNTGGWRRWVRRQSMPDVDAPAPFVPLPERHATIMLEMGLNWMVATRAMRYLIVHAAVVERDGRALVIPGDSGQGKSTLCAALASRGWRLFSDEFAFFDLENGTVVPYPRPISLKNESIEVIRNFAPELTITETLTGTPKGTVAYIRPKADWVARGEEPAEPAAIVAPHYKADARLRTTPKIAGDLFMELATSSVNYDRFAARGFEGVGKLVAGIRGIELHYSALDDAVEAAEALIR
ncbi:MAG: HprK-related kinase A [Sphingomonadales bacterium]|nr:HprK-related kinase A [Sphingomonadales bacterium]